MSEAILPSASNTQPEWLRVVQHKVETLRYGVVQLVVHDGRVTQIDRTEKTLFARGEQRGQRRPLIFSPPPSGGGATTKPLRPID